MHRKQWRIGWLFPLPAYGTAVDAQNQATLAFLAGKKLNREQFCMFLATECVAWTNKNVGLSDFDDFELFDLLRYETNEQSGYIYLARDIDNLPYTDPDDWTLNFLSRLSPGDHRARGDSLSTLSTKTRVDMQELVSTLKLLRLHQKARRKLDLLMMKHPAFHFMADDCALGPGAARQGRLRLIDVIE